MSESNPFSGPLPPPSKPAPSAGRVGPPEMRVVVGGSATAGSSLASGVPARATSLVLAAVGPTVPPATVATGGRSSELPEWLVTDDLSGIPLLTDEVVATPARRTLTLRSLGWAFAAGVVVATALFLIFMRAPPDDRAAALPPVVAPAAPAPAAPIAGPAPAAATPPVAANGSQTPERVQARPAKPANVAGPSPAAPPRRPPPARAANAQDDTTPRPSPDGVSPATAPAACAPAVAALGLCTPP